MIKGGHVFEGWKLEAEVAEWLGKFQTAVNECTGSNCLQFTAVVWGDDKRDGTKNEQVTVHGGDNFPYLDMELVWLANEQLGFRVHLKDNQQLKYVNRGSSHPSHVFKAIPNGVTKRLATLTSKELAGDNQTIDAVYPEHTKALRHAGLAPKTFPTMNELWEEVDAMSKQQPDKGRGKRERQRRRMTFFCLGYRRLQGRSYTSFVKSTT